MEATTTPRRKWLALLILALAGGIIYELPYMRYTYYDPLRDGLGFNHEEFGTLMSVYGVVAMISYLPGGWLADRLSHRKLLMISLVGTGLGGFYLSTWPSYTNTLILFGFWGVLTILTFWSTFVKAVSLLGDATDQGRLFSFAEGGRGIMTSLMALSTLPLYRWLGQTTENFRYILWIYGAFSVVIGILCYFIIDDNKAETVKGTNILKDMLLIIRMPIVWLLTLIIFCIYITYPASGYMTPYLTSVFGLSAVGAGLVATFRAHIFRPISGGVAGVLAKKYGSSIVVMLGVLVLDIIALAALVVLPANDTLVIPMAAITVVIGFFIFMLRGLYFAPVGECGLIPTHLLGAAVGFISTLAFASDTFSFAIMGRILDSHADDPVTGYKYIFMGMIGLQIVAVIGLMYLKGRVKNAQAMNRAKAEAAVAVGADIAPE